MVFDEKFEEYLQRRMDFNRDLGNETIGQIQVNIQNLNQQVQQLDSFISRLSDSSDVGEKQRNLFNEKAQQAQDLSKETNSLMKKLVEMSNSNRSLKVHRERLQNEYIGVLNRLQATQRKAAKTEKASMRQVQESVENPDDDIFGGGSNQQIQQQVQRQQNINLQEIKERKQNLEQLEQDIGDVNAIFAELAKIVHEQGDMVDSIEANVEHAQIHVEQGAQNVQQAVYYNQKARQKKLLLFCFLVILIFIIGLTIYLAK
ncbi:unnamed protein product [Caenorhabditis angaria]|uniref:t-SNARE coiled-coil homology domain-containing protein n=1 Tax=Caenorhabditis angaria TaxID=860376 RepID=A0A9P1I541_9PELO|nr:unnamed protein product [Caenorhabditis angaria]